MIKKRTTGYLLQDIGLLLLLVCLGGVALLVANVKDGQLMEFMVMLLATFFALLLAGFKLVSLSVVAAALETLGYTAYKLYESFAHSEPIQPACYFWLVLPILSVAAMQLFIYANRQTEMENEVLREQVEEQVMINPLTGLYNLRSLYNDLQKQTAYAERNQMQISLMIIKLRYEPELRNVLSRRNYDAMLQKMAVIVTDAVRVEDRIYSLDSHGTIGVILTCDQTNSVYAKNRVRANLENREAFAGIADKAIKVEVTIACLEYKKELYGDDMILFKQRVENELQYDV